MYYLRIELHPATDFRPGVDYGKFLYQFRFICDCLWALIFATLGGMLAQFAAGRSHAQSTAESSRR
jgi:hypothetical protein